MSSRWSSPAARRVLTEGTTEILAEAGYFGGGATKMFGAVFTPPHTPSAGVLICPPLQSEFMTNYRREVLLARMLAARGIAAARFHYRGTGHSYDQHRRVTFESMRQDALEAAAWFCDRQEIESLGFLGTRLSALAAAAVAADRINSPIVFWDPITEGERYFSDVFRFRRMSVLSRGGARSPRDEFAEMRETGCADVFGFCIERGLVDSFRGRELGTVLGSAPRPILLVQMDAREQLKQEYAAFVEEYKRSGSSIDVQLVEGLEAWWFPGIQSQRAAQERNRLTVNATCDWLTRRILVGAPA